MPPWTQAGHTLEDKSPFQLLQSIQYLEVHRSWTWRFWNQQQTLFILHEFVLTVQFVAINSTQLFLCCVTSYVSLVCAEPTADNVKFPYKERGKKNKRAWEKFISSYSSKPFSWRQKNQKGTHNACPHRLWQTRPATITREIWAECVYTEAITGHCATDLHICGCILILFPAHTSL